MDVDARATGAAAERVGEGEARGRESNRTTALFLSPLPGPPPEGEGMILSVVVCEFHCQTFSSPQKTPSQGRGFVCLKEQAKLHHTTHVWHSTATRHSRFILRQFCDHGFRSNDQTSD